MARRTFFALLAIFSRFFAIFSGYRRFFRWVTTVFWSCGGSFGVRGNCSELRRIFFGVTTGVFFGGRGGLLDNRLGFRPVRERSCYPGVLTGADPEEGGSVLSSLRLRRPSGCGFRRCRGGTPAAVAGMPGSDRVSVRSRRGSRGGFRQPRS